jgi:putative FmdB family regulatory protein
MPTYEYGCDGCGAQFEREQSIKDAPIKKCPKCGKSKARRMIAGSGNFILKGGGWYSDLYSGPSNKGKSTGKDADASVKSESKPESKPETKSDSKPKKKADSAAA